METGRPGDLPIWPIVVVALIIIVVFLWRKKPSYSYLLCFAVFCIYLVFALDKAFFPIAISGEYVDSMRQVPFSSFINLTPFNFNLSEMPELVYMQIFQNMLLTIPFGFGVSFVAPIRRKDILWLAPAIGIGIEAIQLLISLMLRYPYRVIDINDAILNALGILIGYGIFSTFAWVYVWATKRLGIRQWGLTAYIYDVARRASTPLPALDEA